MSALTSTYESLVNELEGLDVITDEAKLVRLSKDFSYFSPVLKNFLEGHTADLVIKPKTESEIVQVTGACARHGVPLTMRGSGTGNYGQVTPLEGGVVMDLTAYKAPIWLDGGVARVQAGMRLVDVDKWSRPQGWEMRMVSSTYKLATMGGFFAGGFGGVGSVGYGALHERGTVLGARAITMEPDPQIIEFRGDDALDLHHAYGTNGVITELEFAMAPAMRWHEAIITFDDFMDAARFGQATAATGGVVKKLVTVLADPIPQLCGLDERGVAAGENVALVIMAENARQPVKEIAAEHGGRIIVEMDEDEANRKGTVIEYTWNHTTLHSLKRDKNLTYLQTGFGAGENLEQVEHMRQHFGDEVMMHLEFISANGMATCSGLQLVRYSTEARLNEIIEYHEQQGVFVANPHTHILEDGGKKSTDTRQLAMKRRMDPKGLLNPGKMRAWGDVHELHGDSA